MSKKYKIEFIWGPFDGEIINVNYLKQEYYMPYRTSYETILENDNYSIEWYETVYKYEKIKDGKYIYKFEGWQ